MYIILSSETFGSSVEEGFSEILDFAFLKNFGILQNVEGYQENLGSGFSKKKLFAYQSTSKVFGPCVFERLRDLLRRYQNFSLYNTKKHRRRRDPFIALRNMDSLGKGNENFPAFREFVVIKLQPF